MPYPTAENVKRKIECVFGECPGHHNGMHYFNLDDSTRERLKKTEKIIAIAILEARIEEAKGFEHGNEAWSGNGMTDEEVQSDSPIYNYAERLKKEIKYIQEELDLL